MCIYIFCFLEGLFALILKLISPRHKLETGTVEHETTVNSSLSEVIKKQLLCLCCKEEGFNVYEISHWHIIRRIWFLKLIHVI